MLENLKNGALECCKELDLRTAGVAPDGATITPQPDIADLGADPTQADFNGLLAALRSAGVLIAE